MQEIPTTEAGQKILRLVWNYWLRIGLTVCDVKMGLMRVVLNGEDLLMTVSVTYPMRCDLVLILYYQKKSLFYAQSYGRD